MVVHHKPWVYPSGSNRPCLCMYVYYWGDCFIFIKMISAPRFLPAGEDPVGLT